MFWRANLQDNSSTDGVGSLRGLRKSKPKPGAGDEVGDMGDMGQYGSQSSASKEEGWREAASKLKFSNMAETCRIVTGM